MSVEIDPQELGFHRPFTAEVSEVLKIRNPNPHPVAFKVKTTAPKQYCVRPNSGRVEPGKEVEVSVILQAMKQEPPPDTKCRDKFLVQAVPITSDKEFANLASIWDSMDKSEVQERKIRVVFLPPRGSTPAPAAQAETPRKQSNAGVDQGGLRQRKPGAADDGKSGPKPADLAQQVRAGTEGVPVQITAILCLLSFLLAYLFF